MLNSIVPNQKSPFHCSPCAHAWKATPFLLHLTITTALQGTEQKEKDMARPLITDWPPLTADRSLPHSDPASTRDDPETFAAPSRPPPTYSQSQTQDGRLPPNQLSAPLLVSWAPASATSSMATLGSKRRYDDDDDDDKEYTPPPLEKRRRDNVTGE